MKQVLRNNVILFVICVAIILVVFIIVWKASLLVALDAVVPVNQNAQQDLETDSLYELQYSIEGLQFTYLEKE